MAVADYEVVIGLEVHCQLDTVTKMFTRCAYRVGGEPNTQIDPYTLGLPGTLPVPNRRAVELAIRLGLALGCVIQPVSRWARKHYFYPDLPKGYQITQSDQPYAIGGSIEIPEPVASVSRPEPARIRLERIHLEEDAGKNTHVPGEPISLVDYNRAGVPLVEVVSLPDIRSPAEAAATLRELRLTLRYLGISDANMEAGSLRCDANVSLRPHGARELSSRSGSRLEYGTRCEIKNLNSFKFLEAAIAAEVRRQADLLDRGERVVQSTLSYDPSHDQTRVMRIKEQAADYRYFPEPDLPPLRIDPEWISAARSELVELPGDRRRRYLALGLSAYDAGVLTAEPALAMFFDRTLAAGAPAKPACNWITADLLGLLNGDGREIADSPIPPLGVAEIIDLVERGAISRRAAKEVFDKAYRERCSPIAIVERDGYVQVSDDAPIAAMIREVMTHNPAQLEQLLSGKDKVRGFFVGQVMKASDGRANPAVVNRVLDRLLDELRRSAP